MKKDSIAKLQAAKSRIRRMAAKQRLTVGLDLGDRSSRYCILDEAGGKVSEDQLPTTRAGLESLFGKMAACRIALEVGTHSPWVSRQLAGMGHEVIVANPRKVRLIIGAPLSFGAILPDKNANAAIATELRAAVQRLAQQHAGR